MDSSKLKRLLAEYAAETISKPDLLALLDYVSTMSDDGQLDQLMDELLDDMDTDTDLSVDGEILYRRITNNPLFNGKANLSRWRSLVGLAAAVLLIACTFAWNWHKRGNSETTDKEHSVTRTVTKAPADKPLLRLADGRIINLDSVSGGILASEDGMQITLEGNRLHYQGEITRDEHGKILKNTVITSKGRQYQVVLPDGSKMWLNAATTLTYPVQFDRDKREVEINGEAYFEVEKAEDWPFIVKTETQCIEVLGTHFNVSAYAGDRKAKTTLVEGSVKISQLMQQAVPFSAGPGTRPFLILTPGQQATTYRDREGINVQTVDPLEVVSWKENLFVFNNEEISEVMKKVSRWYDVEVIYHDGMAGKRVGGSIPRFERIEELMDALMATGLLRYKMEGGIVVIME